MAIDMARPRSRRAVMVGAIGALAASLASALGRPAPVLGADGDAVLLGEGNDETKATIITNPSTNGDPNDTAIEANANAGYGVLGTSTSGAGVGAWSEGPAAAALWAQNWNGGLGVLAWSEAPGEFGIEVPDKTGVYGRAIHDTTSVGVRGESQAGIGVRGSATSGEGGRFSASSGYALHTVGRLRLEKTSGLATITAGHGSVTVTPGLNVVAASVVLLTPHSDLGSRRLWCTTDTTANTFRIRVSSAVSSNVQVGWLLLG